MIILNLKTYLYMDKSFVLVFGFCVDVFQSSVTYHNLLSSLITLYY